MSRDPGTALCITDAKRTTRTTGTVDPSLKDLLDHVAEELAREYVSLMKAAAEEDEEHAPYEAGESEEQ